MIEKRSSSNRFRAPQHIFWIALGLRLACIAIGHTYRISSADENFHFGFEAGRIGRSLAEGHGYSDPFNGNSGPTAWLPPLYPLLISLAFKLFGVYTRASAFFILACNSVFSAAIVPAIYEIAARCFDAQGHACRPSKHAQPVALWSASAWAAYPAALQYAIHWVWEMSLSACLFSWALVLTLRLRGIGEEKSASRQSFLRWVMCGFVWGLIALSNATLLLVFPASLLWICWPTLTKGEQRYSLKKSLNNVVPTVVTFLVVLAPWIARNERTLHAFVPTRANLGIELWQSSHFYWRGFPWGSAMSLWPGDPEFQHYIKLGEVQYAREKGAQAIHTLRSNPALFARNTAWRFYFFWFGVPHAQGKAADEVIRTVNYSFLGLAGLLGLWLALRRRLPGAWLFAIVFLLLPLPYYFITVQARFRHPMEPLIAILSVYLFRSTTPRSSATQ